MDKGLVVSRNSIERCHTGSNQSAMKLFASFLLNVRQIMLKLI